MKTYIVFFLALCTPLFMQAQTLSKKEAKKHRKVIEESRKEGTILVSLDTVYYRGNAQFVMLFDHSKYYPENFTVKALKSNAIFISAKDYTGSWVEFVFPTLEGRRGYVKVSTSFEKVARTIIEQGLMEPDGLNVTNVETFLVIYNTASKSAVSKTLNGLFKGDSENKEKQD